MSEETLGLIESMWSDGLLLKEISQRTGLSYGYLSYIMSTNRERFQYRRRRSDRKRRTKYARLVYRGKMSVSEAALEAGVHKNTIWRWVRELRYGKA